LQEGAAQNAGWHWNGDENKKDKRNSH